MKKLLTLSGILIFAILTGCRKEIVTSNPVEAFTSAAARPLGPPAPSILQWQKCLGSSSDDFGTAVAKTSDATMLPVILPI